MPHIGKFKVAVVGVSSESAKAFLPEIFYNHAIKLVAVCDEDSAVLKQTCEAYMINGYCSYDDLIENENLDFVITTVLANPAEKLKKFCQSKTTIKSKIC